MHYRVCQVSLVCSLSNTSLKFLLSVFLQIVCIVSTVSDALAASLQAPRHLGQRFLVRVKAVHAAASTLKVHYVKLLVQESVKCVRSNF